MLEAFDLIRLVEKLPLKICAVATWSNWFIVSTVSSKNEAHLLVYKVVPGTDFDKLYEAKLERTLKKFTAKPVINLAVIPEYNFFLALTNDGELHCADLSTYLINTTILPRSKGVYSFAVDWYKLKGYERKLRIVVSSKKRLMIYTYKGGTFTPSHDLPVPENPRSVYWIGDSLIICIKKDLFHLTLDGNSKEVFPIGQTRTEPCILPVTRGDKQEILILNDEKQISLDSEAKPTQPAALIWSDLPICIEHVHPYIIGVLPKGIEVRALEQKIQIQSMKMSEHIKDQIKIIAHDKMTLVASHTQVYKLEPRAYDKQVQQHVQQRNFDLALEIAELIQESEEERKQRREEILRRYAFYLFAQLNFEKSLKYYLEIKEDPVNVIGLYPHLLPSDLRQSLTLPSLPPTLAGEDLKKGTEHLINYLTQMRYIEQQKLQQKDQPIDDIKKLEARLQLIDTTLLKCYIKTGNNTLIGSLVRLPDNHLHLAESERVLRNEEKFPELVQLFGTKGQHKKALELLLNFRKGPSNSLSGVWPTIDYLQNLGCDNLSLILEYSKWVLVESPDDGIKIFTEEIGEVESLPRAKVLGHIAACASHLKIQYLEHIIHRWRDKTPEFHNNLILFYKEEVEKRLQKYLQQNKGRPRPKAGEEPDQLGLLRSKLLNFLESSHYYQPETLISKFPSTDLFEERALLLGRLGRHDVALAMYAHILRDPKMAEDYCRKMYDPEKEENKEVYLSLIQMYLYPPSLDELGIKEQQHPQPARDINTAMSVLAAYHDKIDTAKVMGMLPADTPIQDIRNFLSTVLEENMIHKRKNHVLRCLLLTEHLQVQKMRIKEQSPHFVVDDYTLCNICHKKLGTSAFARYPNGDLGHYYCYQQMQEAEEDYNY